MVSVSAQSQPIDDLEALRDAAARADASLPDPVPCPPDWIWFRLVPHRIEQWRGSRDRVHERIVARLEGGVWSESRLQP